MKKGEMFTSEAMYQYMLDVSLRESELLKALREETMKDPLAVMQIPPEQGQFMALLVKMLGARRTLEIGTFTGYSTLCVAMALPEDGLTVACDVSEEWTNIAQRYWVEAGIDHKIDLRLAPALETLDSLLKEGKSDSFDFAFIDADKANYNEYYEMSLALIRRGGLIAIDNVFLFGAVLEPERLLGSGSSMSMTDVNVMRALNEKLKHDKRVDLSMLPIADGLTLARKH